jgi:hypothetical protein
MKYFTILISTVSAAQLRGSNCRYDPYHLIDSDPCLPDTNIVMEPEINGIKAYRWDRGYANGSKGALGYLKDTKGIPSDMYLSCTDESCSRTVVAKIIQ